MLRQLARHACTAACVSLTATAAGAQAIITNGTIKMGVDQLGQLNIPGGVLSEQGTTTVVGLRFLSGGKEFESTADGCLCEGWGVGINGGSTGAGTSGYANNSVGTAGLTLVSFTSTATSATSVTDVGSYLQITHDYHPDPKTPYLYDVNVTIKNLSSSTLGAGPDGILYRRVMDWDIEPKAFDEVVSLQGWPATNLIHTSDSGFQSGDPFSDYSGTGCAGAPDNANFGPNGPCDHGALFDFGFPALAPGASHTFTTFYGAGPDEKTVLAALGTVGAEVYTIAWCGGSDVPGVTCNGPNGPAVFTYGFAGVGGTPLPPPSTVPEPSTYAMLAAGLVGLGAFARRRMRAG